MDKEATKEEFLKGHMHFVTVFYLDHNLLGTSPKLGNPFGEFQIMAKLGGKEEMDKNYTQEEQRLIGDICNAKKQDYVYEDLYTRKRCWGYYPSYDMARKSILRNWTDMYENGYYNLAMIESILPGIVNLPASTWFKVIPVSKDSNNWIENYEVSEIEKPKRFKNYIGFSYA
jgi:hypothetical protein